MSQASSRPDRTSPESNRKGAILPPSRIVLVVLVITIGVVAYHEYQVRSAFDESRRQVQEHMPAEKTQESTLYLKDMPKYLQGSPEHSTPQADVDAYTWKGWIFSYEIRVTHEPDGYVHKLQFH
jgi:cytochrome c-type biogenesis protein CcmH/NrfG